MKKLNKRKVRWIIKQMLNQELSVWQIAKQQNITPRWARKLFEQYKQTKQFPFPNKPGRPPKPVNCNETRLVKEFYAKQPMGATNMEKILSLEGHDIPHNRIHKILHAEGLACIQPNKSRKRKWVRFERKHANSLWHIDWTDHEGKYLCAIIDDASRLIVGHDLFANATAENAALVLEKAIHSYGAPKQLISDHGTQFTSLERDSCLEPKENAFQQTLKHYGIQHIKARIKHPQTNGKIERWFQTNAFLTKHFGNINVAIKYYNEQRPRMSLENGSLRTPLQAFMEKI